MNKARVKIQKDFGDYTDKLYSFYTDFNDLKAGDIVIVLTGYGIKIAVFVEYDTSKYEPNNFLLNKISEPSISLRKMELKEKLVDSALKEMNDFVKRVYAL